MGVTSFILSADFEPNYLINTIVVKNKFYESASLSFLGVCSILGEDIK